MNHKTVLAIMSLHRKQMAEARARGDMLGFEWAAFRHRQLVRAHLPTMYALWAKQSPEKAAQEAMLFDRSICGTGR